MPEFTAMPPSGSDNALDWAPFVPHPLLRGGHVQTLAGAYLPGRSFPYRATQHQVPLADGDCVVLHDDCPPDWRPSAPTVLLIHGLGGSHASPYMRRLAGKFFHRSVRTFRMDLRGAGAGARLAKIPYHSGRSDDAATAVRAIAELCPNSPTTIIGFSLGGNITLKLLGEIGAAGCGNLVSGIAVSPPVELLTCCERIRQRDNRVYDRRFVRALLAQHRERIRLVPGAPAMPFTVEPKSLLELDDRFTGPINGYGNAENYYRQCSSSQFVPRIRLPTLIITAADDPMIPVEIFSRMKRPENVSLHIAESGGHLGFISHGQGDPDRRWMDWRILEWLTTQQSELAIAK